MKNNKIKQKEETYELAYKVACLIQVVSKSCYYDDRFVEADTLKQAYEWQFEIIDMLEVL